MGSKRLIVPGKKRLALPTQGLPNQPLTPIQPFVPAPAMVGRPPLTRDELFWFILACWGVAIPRQRVCPEHTPPFEALAEAFFGEKSVTIWIGSRGFGGKTKTLSILGMTEMVALGAFVTILGGSGQQSLRVHETMQEAWEHPGAPTDLLAKDPTQLSTFLTNGAKARTLMASTKSVRGPHPQRMRLDEIDEMDMNVLESAQGQPMSTKKIKSQTVMSSTHQYPNGTVTAVLRRAGELGWPVRRWCFLETSNPIDGWLNPEEIDRKRSEIPRHMWESEYELFEPSFDSRAIEPDIVERAFDLNLGYAEADVNTEVIVHEPLYNRDYVTAVDWAKAKDYTVVWTFDTTTEPWTTVAFARMGRRPWPDMVGYVNKRIKHYPGKLVHDATGIGSVIDDYIEIPDTMSESDVVPIIMAGRARNDMITNYVSALENGLIKTPRIQYAYEEHKFASVDDLYNGTSKAHLPDSIAAGALGWSQRNTWAMDFAEPTVMTRPASPWKIG